MTDGLEDLITKFEARVHFVPGAFIKGKNAVTYKALSGYIILMRESLSTERIPKVAEHELWHIILGHLDEHKEMSTKDKELEVTLNMEQPLPT